MNANINFIINYIKSMMKITFEQLGLDDCEEIKEDQCSSSSESLNEHAESPSVTVCSLENNSCKDSNIDLGSLQIKKESHTEFHINYPSGVDKLSLPQDIPKAFSRKLNSGDVRGLFGNRNSSIFSDKSSVSSKRDAFRSRL